MKRSLLVALLSMSTFAFVAASPLTAQAKTQHCKTHGYSVGYCQVIPTHTWVGFHVPHYKHHTLELYVRHFRGMSLDVEIEDVGCPAGAPSNAQCFEVDFFDHNTGMPVTNVRDFVFKFGTAFQYDPQNGHWFQVHDNEATTGGLFYFIP